MAQKTQQDVPGLNAKERKVRFDYIKSNYFRVIHVDGIQGGNCPGRDLIQMAAWSERWPIPRQSVFPISPEGALGEEILPERVTRDAIVREVEVELLMNIATARVIRDWLNDRIEEYEKMSSVLAEKEVE